MKLRVPAEPTEAECVDAPGSLGSSGYARTHRDGKQSFAHRAAYMDAHGSIPEGMLVLHLCDNKRCINPEHLYLGTYADNSRDARERGQMAVGSRGSAAKITEEDAAEIRRLYATGKYSYRDLGLMYGLNANGTIQPLIKRKTWRHV